MSTHIGAREGDIAKGILLPGDPLRAKYISENYLQNSFCFNTVRNMLGFTGEYKGKQVSVMGTGMGIPSISIYITELMKEYEVKYLIRVGTCGAMQPDIGLKDIVIAQGACTTSDINHHIFPGNYCPLADFDMLRTAHLKSKESGIKIHIGNMISSDMFYSDNRSDIWSDYGVKAGEMETAALYTLAKRYGTSALSMVTVADSKYIKGELSSTEREQSLDSMIKLALETIIEFV